MKNSLRLLSPLLLASLGLGTGCSWSNAHHDQELPPITRLTTVPAPATVEIVETGVRLETPANLDETVEPDTVIRISKDGRILYEGPIGDLTQVALGHYRFERR